VDRGQAGGGADGQIGRWADGQMGRWVDGQFGQAGQANLKDTKRISSNDQVFTNKTQNDDDISSEFLHFSNKKKLFLDLSATSEALVQLIFSLGVICLSKDWQI
jgi:hypothetical protein